MSNVNGIEIPEAGATQEYITDKVGGFMYLVTTNVTVNQYRLDEYEKMLALAKATAEKATADAQALEAANPEKKP